MPMEKEQKATNNKPENNVEKNEITTTYEVGFVLVPAMSEEKMVSEVATIKSIIEKSGAEIISDEMPVMVDLAYSMTKIVSAVRSKYSKGYFGWLKFEVESSLISEIKKELDASDTILRYLIIKTVKENTLLNGKMTLKKEEKAHKTDEYLNEEIVEPSTDPVVSQEIKPEELDKSIDELVII